MSAIDRSYDMTSFSVRDILNLPDTGLCSSKSETTHESSSTESYHCPGGNTHTPSCGSVVCNQGQEYSYTSKNELDFVSLIERKVNAGIYEVLNSIDGKNLAEVLERVYFVSSVNYGRRDGFFAYNRISFPENIQWRVLRGNCKHDWKMTAISNFNWVNAILLLVLKVVFFMCLV